LLKLVRIAAAEGMILNIALGIGHYNAPFGSSLLKHPIPTTYRKRLLWQHG